MIYDELSTLTGMTARLPLLTTNLDICNINYVTENYAEFPHSHLFHEIYYVLQGNLSFSINSQIVSLEKNDLLYIQPGIMHERIFCPQENFSYFVISFELNGKRTQPLYSNQIFMEFLKDEQMLLSRLISVPFQKAADLCGCNDEINSLCNCLQQHYMAGIIKVYSYISSFFIAAAQSLTGLRSRQDFDDFSIGIVNKAARIHQYMVEHCSEPLTLQTVSKAVHYSSRQIQRIIYEHYGVNFSEMLAFCRVYKAKTLLCTTQFSMEHICDLCGFGNYQTMLKHFQSIEKTSPTTYRRKFGYFNDTSKTLPQTAKLQVRCLQK